MTPRTRAVVAVDLFGLPAPVPELRELGVPVLEDAAQAAGARCGGRMAGALGDAATFSFYPSKNLGAFGDGGAIATDDDRVAELRPGPALPRLAGQADVRARRLQLAPGRAAGGDPAGAAPGARRLVRRAAGRRPRPTSRRAWARTSVFRWCPRGHRPRLAPVRRHPPAADEMLAALARPGSRRAATTAAAAPPAGDGAASRPAPAPCRSPMSWRRPTSRCRSARCSVAEQAREVVAAIAAADIDRSATCASGSI